MSDIEKSPLTFRETTIVEYMSDGYSDAEIAELLKISARTVRFHIDNAKRKLAATNRVHLAAKHIRQGSPFAPVEKPEIQK